VKNRQRWSFGGVQPRPHEPWAMQTQCLVEGPAAARLEVRVRFLHLVAVGDGEWHEAIERDVALPAVAVGALVGGGHRQRFAVPAWSEGHGAARRWQAAIAGAIELDAEPVDGGAHRLTVAIHNLTPEPAAGRALELQTMASCHTLFAIEGGDFVSLFDPPEALRSAAEACSNVGTWPVLVGPAGRRDAMLSSPIILYDHPEIAPESPGDLFDGTEIDEILSLRILTLTDDEKAAARAADPRVRALIDRTEALSADELAAMHGTMRRLPPGGLQPGARVRLRPRGRADAFDLALAGKLATVCTVERSVDGGAFVTVTVDDDPGADLGAEGEVGHRFFFRLDEVEPVR
jgi:hypothetical protein